jgi:DNA-binding MarR family transcriptional regulator
VSSESRRRSELLTALGRELRRFSDQNAAFNQAVSDALGLNATDLRCITALALGGPANAGQLAELTGLTTGAVTGIIDRLERAGFARRTKDPQDRRQVIVDAGGDRRRELDQLLGAMNKALLAAAEAYKEDQLSSVIDFLARAAAVVQREAERLRPPAGGRADGEPRPESSAPLGRATRGLLRFAGGGFRVQLRGDANMPDLYRATFQGRPPGVKATGGEVTIQYARFSILDWRKLGAEVTLNAAIPWALEVRGGVSKLSADLSSVEVTAIDLSGGVTDVLFQLPEPKGRVQVSITGGASDVTLRRPRGVGARVEIKGGVSKLQLDEQQFGAIGGIARVQSKDYSPSAGRYDIQVLGGASRLTVEPR